LKNDIIHREIVENNQGKFIKVFELLMHFASLVFDLLKQNNKHDKQTLCDSTLFEICVYLSFQLDFALFNF